MHLEAATLCGAADDFLGSPLPAAATPQQQQQQQVARLTLCHRTLACLHRTLYSCDILDLVSSAAAAAAVSTSSRRHVA
jgi:hypothetical protein